MFYKGHYHPSVLLILHRVSPTICLNTKLVTNLILGKMKQHQKANGNRLQVDISLEVQKNFAPHNHLFTMKINYNGGLSCKPLKVSS